MANEFDVRKSFSRESMKGMSGLIIAGVVLLFLFVLNPIVIVGAGERGVVFSRFSGVKEGIMQEGLNFRLPGIESVIKMDVKTQKLTRSSEGASKDLQSVQITTVVNYHLDAAKVGKLYQEVGMDFERKVIEPSIEEAVKAGTALFPVENIIVERPKLKAVITETLGKKLLLYDLMLEDVNITDIRFSDEFNRVVEQKQIEEQKIKTAEYQKKQAEQHKQRVILEAEGEAEKQRLIRTELTKDIISMEWIKKWDGKLPVTVLGDSMPLINIGK
ncbi:prohibitin family protein [candidate division FCPU426 bacterium]|nr:prohibitin family protein [candidate division FCPU426 bacterium]